jgi:hypothetical protein
MGEQAIQYLDPATKKVVQSVAGGDAGALGNLFPGINGGGGGGVIPGFGSPTGDFGLPGKPKLGKPDFGTGSPLGGFGMPTGGAIPGVGGGGVLEGLLGGLAGFNKPFTDSNDPWMIFHKKEKKTYEPANIDEYFGSYEGSTGLDGKISDSYKLNHGQNLDSRLMGAKGLSTLRDRATQTGPSTWAKMAEESQRLDEQNLLNQASEAQAGQVAGARSGLAMRGGLRGGAAERLAASGQENALLGGQGIRNQGMQGRLGIGMQDESNKLNLLSQLPGAELSQAGYLSGLDQQNYTNTQGVNQFNIANALADLNSKNEFKKTLATSKLQAKGAADTASATENAGKK